MKKNSLTFVVFVLVGLLAGTIISQLLAPYSFFSFLTHSAQITWQPRADLSIIKYDLHLQIKLNLASILGLVLAIWIYRKL